MKSKHTIILVVSAGVILLVGALLWYRDEYGGRAAGLAESDQIEDRVEATVLLRGKSNSLARETLFKLSQDSELRVALAAVRSLEANTDARNGEVLRHVLDSGAAMRVRGAAAAALGKYESVQAKTLVDILVSDKDPVLRAGAAEGLGRKDDPAGVDALVTALNDPEELVRQGAIVGLQRSLGVRFLYDPAAPSARRRQAMARIRQAVKSMRLDKPR